MSDAENWSPRDLAEMIKKGEISALTELGMLSYSDADYISDYFDSYERYHNSSPAEDGDKEYERMIRRAGTRELNKAVFDGNISQIAFAVGNTREAESLEDWNTVEIIKDMYRKNPKHNGLSNNVFQAILFSSNVPPTGRGKSSFAYTNIEIAKTVHEDLHVKTNNPSDEFETIPKQFDKLKNWIETQDGEKLILLDEAKQFLMFEDHKSGKILSKLLALNRHNRCHMLVVGHTGAGIPKDLRRQMFFIDKQSEKKATIGYGLTSSGDERYEVNNVLYEFDNIPHTNLDYESEGEESINLEFSSTDDETDKKEELVKALYNEGKTQEEIADLIGESQPNISDILN